MDATAQHAGLQRSGGGVQLQQPGAQLTVSRSRRSLDLRVLDGRAPSHPTESGDSAGTPRRALKPASRGPTTRARPRDHDAGTPAGMRSWRRHPFLGSARRGRESRAHGRERDTLAKKGSCETAAGTLGSLRPFHPARGGEVLEVLPAARPRNAPKPSWTVSLVRRATPFFAIAAVYAIQVSAGAGPVLAFPLYLTVILLTALQLSRVESLATAFLAAIAILVPSVVGGDLGPALLLAICTRVE